MESLWIPRFGAHIRFHDLPGDEPALVLLHGLGSASSSDYPSITRRRGLCRHRCILPDFLGFGYSDRPRDFDYSLEAHAETVFEILTYLNLSGIYLFGHSMGGAIAIALAAAHPELISRLVLAEANLDPGVGQASKAIADQPERDYVAEGHTRFVESIRQAIPDTPSLAGYLGALQLADPTAMHRSSVGLIRGTAPAQRELFLSMKIPRAYIFGEYSLPDPDVDLLSSAGIDVPIVQNAGHGMMDDNPDGFASALLRSFQVTE